MLKRCIHAENRKLHASPIWVMFFLLPVLPAAYGTFNYLQNLEILTDGWSIWAATGISSWPFPCGRWICLPPSSR